MADGITTQADAFEKWFRSDEVFKKMGGFHVDECMRAAWYAGDASRQAEVDRLAAENAELRKNNQEITKIVGDTAYDLGMRNAEADQLRELAGELVEKLERLIQWFDYIWESKPPPENRETVVIEARAALAKAKALGIGGEG